MCMNSVSGLCLCLGDTVLRLNLSFKLCRWLVEDDDVEGVQEVLVRQHQCLISRVLLRL